MELHYELQNDLLSKIIELWSKYNALPQESRTRYRVSHFLTRLDVFYDQFTKKHDGIMKSKTRKSSDDYFVNKVEDAFVDTYWDLKDKFETVLRSFDPQSHADDDSQSMASLESYAQRPHMQMNLPPINLQPFSGEQEDWENFRDLYKSVIHFDQVMSLATKFYYLKSLLRGEALEVIRAFPLTINNYTNAWETLCYHYENTRRLTHKSVHDLLNIKPVTVASATSLGKLLKDVLGPIDLLKKLNRTSENILDDILVYLLSHNLDRSTKIDWQNSLGSHTEPPTLKEIRTFILERQAALECSEYENTKHWGSKTPPKPK